MPHHLLYPSSQVYLVGPRFSVTTTENENYGKKKIGLPRILLMKIFASLEEKTDKT